MSPVKQTFVTDAATTLCEVTFVRLCVHGCGATVAVVSVVGRMFRILNVPFRIHVTDAPDTVAHDDVATVVGLSDADADLELDPNDTVSAVHGLGVDPDPAVALAGLHTTDTTSKEDIGLTDTAAGADVGAGPGVAVPTGGLADRLARSTLVRVPFSADRERTQVDLTELLLPAELDADVRRYVAFLIAVDVTSDETTTRATTAVKRVLGPETTPGGLFETIGGLADVSDATVRESPGTAVTLTLRHDVRGIALDAWRDHVQTIHAALRGVTTGHYESLSALSYDLSSLGRFAAVAGLARNFHLPKPTVLTIGVGAAAFASTGFAELDEDLAVAASDLPAVSVAGSPSEVTVTFDSAAEPSDVVAAVGEVHQ